jgi:hypothetical protein
MIKTNLQLKLKCWIVFAVTLCCFSPQLCAQSQHRIIEILADRDSRYKIAGQKQPVITAKPGEELTLRITARKAQTQNRDGSVHGLTLLRAKDKKPVDGWDLLLKPGTHDFEMIAPAEPGEYVIVCTVICSPDHEMMNMRFVVEP